MSGKKVTVKTLSDYCNVSVATISRVINNNGRFSEETRQRVLRAIDELGYIPNVSAKTLRMNASRLVGIFVNSLQYEMTSSTVIKLQKYLLDRGYVSIICNTGIDAENESQYFDMMMSLNVCAIFMLVVRSGSKVPERVHVPIIYIYKNPLPVADDNAYVLETNDFEAGYIAGSELIRLGCRTIAEVRLKSLDERIPLGRHLGLLQSLYEHNVPFAEDLSIVSQASEFPGILQTINAALDATPAADGYFCVSDVMALCLIRGLELHGYRVPEDVKVIGCNDMPIAMYNNKAITTIRHQLDELCLAAVTLMEDILAGKTISKEDRRQVFHVSLVPRETT